ncbi:uncharacterized protein LOC127872558 [Dreissena polymorpha]|uniref:uncharacterized protein LOC127872558 n=1 Tax=Dreissena polymorpha TaxID=45954 RepID=UPI00226413BB|nr:uncharacterized protein LOC127872558 [Dreissena polymorpha]
MEQTTPECEILDLAEQLRTGLEDDTKDYLDVFAKCNEVLKRFGKEEIVPVGSSVDDSKISTNEDFGDVDVLVIAKTINLDESLFEYERDYPSFLRLRGNGVHAYYFDENDLVDKQWVKANVLKDLQNSKFFVLTKLFWILQTLPLSIIKATGVGFEFSSFDINPKTITLRNISIDCVPAFSFSGWPRPASEWLHRTRYWPIKEVIEEIVNTGCQIVAKRPLYIHDPGDENRSPEEIETDVIFRLSFSKCELVLSKTMSKSQLMLWRILKAYQKGFLQVKPKVLASYHWKNVVFWISEEENHEFWNPKNLLKAIVKALDFMIDCLTKEFIPFYFVRIENLIAGCRRDMILETLQMVKEIRSQPLDALRQFIQNPPKREKPGNLPIAITYFNECLENMKKVNPFEENATSEVNIGDVFALLDSCSDPKYHSLQETQRQAKVGSGARAGRGMVWALGHSPP